MSPAGYHSYGLGGSECGSECADSLAETVVTGMSTTGDGSPANETRRVAAPGRGSDEGTGSDCVVRVGVGGGGMGIGSELVGDGCAIGGV